ncbi:MAG: transketolase [Candidatus Omnitrophica bacterium]|nr:transketolase [Candidatus Omnitrophota bacterium]
MQNCCDINALKQKALLVRQEILELTNMAGSGHPGGSLSAVEILVALYDCQLRHDPKNPRWPGRDMVIISKGHVSPVVYSVLANAGYFSKDEYKKYRKLGGILQGHVTTKTPGVEFNTGSLGHGLAVANGLAIGAKLLKKDQKMYCLMGDGEIQEGSVWEAAMSAAQFKLDNVCAIVDYNKVQENGMVNDIMNLEPLKAKWESFGWVVAEIDGNKIEEVLKAYQDFGKINAGKPYVIIANTIKGKGVSFMELKSAWHGKAPNNEQLAAALKELS